MAGWVQGKDELLYRCLHLSNGVAERFVFHQLLVGSAQGVGEVRNRARHKLCLLGCPGPELFLCFLWCHFRDYGEVEVGPSQPRL